MFAYLTIFFCVISILAPLTAGQLDYRYCWAALLSDSRIAASLLRLHFHDCFVNGCDGSVLLDDTNNFKGEKNAAPNRNSARGYETIDIIKADLERACPYTVSCVDILTLAAREVVVKDHFGQFYLVDKDGLTASEKAANEQYYLHPLRLWTKSLRLFDYQNSGKPDPNLDSSMLSNLQSTCPDTDGSNSKLTPLDIQSVTRFDNAYYRNLMNNSGLLESDQAQMSNSETADMVKSYSLYPYLFYEDFAASMVKLGNVGVLTGRNGQIRKVCGSVNY
ncbi:unnamed protein product [Withania somnifera]